MRAAYEQAYRHHYEVEAARRAAPQPVVVDSELNREGGQG